MSPVKLSEAFMIDTVDDRNPKQPPGMYKTLLNNGTFTISAVCLPSGL